MNPDNNTRTKKKLSSTSSVQKTVNSILQSLNSQISLITPHIDQITENLHHLGLMWSEMNSQRKKEIIIFLSVILRKISGAPAKTIFDFLKDQIHNFENPWFIFGSLIHTKDQRLLNELFRLILNLVRNENLQITEDNLLSLLKEKDIGKEKDTLILFKDLLHHLPDNGESTLLKMYMSSDQLLSKLAATILDLNGETVDENLIKKVIGIDHYRVLAPYLKFTCASYTDLHCLKNDTDRSSLVASIAAMEKLCNMETAREIIAETGWPRLNKGFEIRPVVEVKIKNALPYFVSPHQTTLFTASDSIDKTDFLYMITAQSGESEKLQTVQIEEDRSKRYRAYNLRHAEVLSQILDIAPLTLIKATAIVRKMEQIVQDHVILFSQYTDECAILPAVFKNIADKIKTEIKKSKGKEELSLELTRLIQMFEDPENIGKVQTLHGLKRYLHQQGLKLGFRLVSGSQAAKRNVLLLLLSRNRLPVSIDKISYTDFEPDKTESMLPVAVQIVIQSYFRQLLYGQGEFPHVKIFCYGNEVQYYITYRNHPAFLRIDYAPPFLGGMIDLEFYGISNYELDVHPNISLNYIQQIFEFLDFDFQMDGTRIHARYDKERAPDLGKLFEKAEEVFCLVPYLMDIDWIIGSLKLNPEAKDKISEAWGAYVRYWGCIPANKLLTANRTSLIREDAKGLSGMPTCWSGEGKYEDRYTYFVPKEYYSLMNEQLLKWGVADLILKVKTDNSLPGQLEIERSLFRKLERRVECGLLKIKKDKYEKADPVIIKQIHEACFFAEFLCEKEETLLCAMNLGRIIRINEKMFSFTRTGTINGYAIEKASLSLGTHDILIFVLRDALEEIKIAVYTEDELIYYRRLPGNKKKSFNIKFSTNSFLQLLRKHHYVLAFDSEQNQTALSLLNQFRDSMQSRNKVQGGFRFIGEKIVSGLKASPGRAIGRVLFYSQNRPPGDYSSRILISPAIRPEDNPYLFQSAGIVSTGGGILSHAGLTAIQFKKPALIVQGRWEHDKKQSGLYLLTTDFNTEKKIINNYEVSIHKDIRSREILVKEGDLVVLNAKQGHLRIIGQEPETIMLYEELEEIQKTSMKLTVTKHEKDILTLRGRRLKARYQLEKVLRELQQPIVASFAAEEILLGPAFSLHEGKSNEQSHLLEILTKNRNVGKIVLDYIYSLVDRIKNDFNQLLHKAQVIYPTALTLCDILYLRSEIGNQLTNLRNLYATLIKCGFLKSDKDNSVEISERVDLIAYKRVSAIKDELTSCLRNSIKNKRDTHFTRHYIRQIERIHQLINEIPSVAGTVTMSIDQLNKMDEEDIKKLSEENVIAPIDCGLVTSPIIGWKAANLAEVNRLVDGALIPPWFVVTDHAFQQVLNLEINYRTDNDKLKESTLRNVIHMILDRNDLSFDQKSNQIYNLWEQVELPIGIEKDVLSAYHQLESEHKKSDPNSPFYVAIRSSSREEDAENAARAGEFATYLYISGEFALLQFLKRTWSGLWTERAIHNRAVYHSEREETGGGVIVQKIVCSRVSGVLQTVNVGKGEMQEMVINAGLGLGEGVVSGTVGTDQIIILKKDKPEQYPLKINYITSDKKEQVVFNQKTGIGTIKAKTVYHQRLRPALEYAEIAELVYLAYRLEKIYGYPLDIEFGIENNRLWILQVRPVAIFTSMLEENMNKYPFVKQN